MYDVKDVLRRIYGDKKVGNLYTKILSNTASNLGLSKPEADVLIFFYNNPEYNNAKDLVRVRGLSKSYVSKALVPLIEKELITVKDNKEDRRYQIIELTEKATDICIKLRKSQDKFIDIITTSLSKQEMETYLKVIDKIIENADKALNN